jgi:hypothetical protein
MAMFVPIKLRRALVKVVDNFLSQQQFDKLQSDIISIHFPWYFQTGVTNDGVYDDSCLLTHVFYDNDMVNSPGLPIVQPLLNMINIEKLLRVKANLYPNNGHFIHHKKRRAINKFVLSETEGRGDQCFFFLKQDKLSWAQLLENQVKEKKF